MKTKSVVIGILGVGIVAILLSWNHLFPPKPATVVANPSELKGIQTGDAPWNPEIAHLRDRLKQIGLPALPSEGNVLHTHQHLDLVIYGATTTLPSGIGVNAGAQFISPIHVHDTTGIIHVESATVRDFTLGEFFDVWGVRFTTNCIGRYCADSTHTLKVYSNGTPVSKDYRNILLTPHEELMIVYGDASSTSPIIPTFTFPPSY